MLYAGCPLFSCVKIKPDPAPQDYTQNTVKAVMYANNGNGVAPVLGSVTLAGTTEGVALLSNDKEGNEIMSTLAMSVQETGNQVTYIKNNFNAVVDESGTKKVYTASRG